MPFLCASFCQGLCFRRSEARVAQPARALSRVRVDIPNNVVRDIEYGQNSMSEIKTLAHKMDIGRYGKLGTLGPKIFVACGGQKVVFTIGGVFAIHIRSATPRAKKQDRAASPPRPGVPTALVGTIDDSRVARRSGGGFATRPRTVRRRATGVKAYGTPQLCDAVPLRRTARETR
jgi:hypothetical protein